MSALLLMGVSTRGGVASASPSFNVTPDDDTVSGAQGTTIDIVYTLSRSGGHTATVTPSVTGLPSGVSGSWSDSSLSGADTTTTLTLTIDGAASTVTNDAFTASFTDGTNTVDCNGTVTVTAASDWAPNLPAGLTFINETYFDVGSVDFNTPGDDGLSWEEGEFAPNIPSGGSFAIIANPLASHSHVGSHVGETRYKAGTVGGGTGGARIVDGQNNNWTEFYCCRMIAVSANYSWHSNSEKFIYMFSQLSGGGTLYPTIVNWEQVNFGGSPGSAECGMEFTSDLSSFEAWAPFNRNQPEGLTKGEWRMLEVYMKVSTSGSANGIFRAWLDNVLVADYTNMQYGVGAGGQVYLQGYRDDGTRGAGDSTVPVPTGGQSRYYGRTSWWAKS